MSETPTVARAATPAAAPTFPFLIAGHINLLPYRDQRRQAQRRDAAMTLAFAGFIAIGALLLTRGVITHQTGNVAHLNQVISRELEEIDHQVGEIQSLEQEMQVLMARQSAIAVLQRERMQASRLLAQLADLVPANMYVSRLGKEGAVVTLTGVAASNQDISALLANLGRPAWIRNPQLLESRTRAAEGSADARPVRRAYFDFTIKFTYDEPQDAAEGTRMAAAGTDITS